MVKLAVPFCFCQAKRCLFFKELQLSNIKSVIVDIDVELHLNQRQYFSMKSLRYSVIKTQVQNELSKYDEHDQQLRLDKSLQHQIQKFKSIFTIQEFLAQYLGQNTSHRLVHCLMEICEETKSDNDSEQDDIYDRLLKMELYKCPSQTPDCEQKRSKKQLKTEQGVKSEANVGHFQKKTHLGQKEHLEAIVKSLGQLNKIDQEKQKIVNIISGYSLKQETQCGSKKHQDFKSLWQRVCSKIEEIKKADLNLNQQQMSQIFSFVQNLISIHNQIENELNNFLRISSEKQNSQFESNSSNITVSTAKRSLLTQLMKEAQQKKTVNKSVAQSLKQYRIESFQNNTESQVKNETIETPAPVQYYKSGQVFGEPYSMTNKKIKNSKTKSQKVLLQQIDMNSGQMNSNKRNKQIKEKLNTCGSCSQCIIF